MVAGVAYGISKIDINHLTTDEVQDLYLVDHCLVEKYCFLKQFRDISEYKHSFLSRFREPDNELFIIKKHSLICGVVSFIKSTDWNGLEQYKLRILLCDSTINHDLIECLSDFINKKIITYGQFVIVTYDNELAALIENYSYQVNVKANVYTLKKEEIEIELLNKSIQEYQTKNNDLYLIYTDNISEAYIEPYCHLFTETMEDMTDAREEGYTRYIITPEKQRQINESDIKENRTHHCYMIFNSKNEMVGMTNISVNNKDSRFPYQFMVGVSRPYRGRGLGKWLYAAMYKKLWEEVAFEKVLVMHHPENKPMINISESIGYKFSYLETTYLVHKF